MSHDLQALTSLNDRFIEAWRQGSWELLEPVLSAQFRYLDGATGELWDMPRYIDDLQSSLRPRLRVDELVIHMTDGIALVSARSSSRPGRFNRYVDIYQSQDAGWLCVSACVWPLLT